MRRALNCVYSVPICDSKNAKIEENGGKRFRIDSIETHLQKCIYVQA